jgi:membrane fusion protein (multidrug efflux system)
VDAATPNRQRNAAGPRVLALFLRRLETRATLVVTLLVAVVLAGAAAIARNGLGEGVLTGREATDDAYIRADQIAIASHVAGYVQTVAVADNALVRKGDLIAVIRDDDYRARVDAAQAALDAALSAVGVLEAQTQVLEQKADSAAADRRGVEAGLVQSRLQHARQRELLRDGATSQRELEAAAADEDRLSAVRDQKDSELRAARQALEVVGRQVDEARQTVKSREAALVLARIDLGYTRIVAPASGQLSARGALPGEYVQPGSRLGLLVPLPDVWVVANFRESQIARMRPGQAAEITVDGVPGRRFRGAVESFGPASGALQALLPPDNATGNFTKVAQRFAVKIVLAPGQPGAERLRAGMSAIATVAVTGGRSEGSER